MFYAERPGLAEKPFSEQMQILLADGFSFGDAWKYYLEASGRYEVMEVVLNAEPAQRQWAREHGVRHSEENWSEAILAAQLADSKPDIWFCHSWLSPAQRLRLRRACPSIRYVIGYEGMLNHVPEVLAGCDAVLSCVSESAPFYTRAGFRGYWMPWCFDPRLLAKLKPSQERHQVSFCGSIMLAKKLEHFGRARLLGRLQRDLDINLFFCSELDFSMIERVFLSHLYRRNFDLAWRTLQVYPAIRRLRRINCGERFGLAMFQTLADSKVTLNIHGDRVKTAANIRLFEATGVGTCLLTDWKDDLPKVFEPDQEVVTFRSHEECVEKVRYLLDHEEGRRAIAAAGQKRCLRDHNMGDHILKFAAEVLDQL